PLPLHARRQERHVPAPDFAWFGGDMGGGRTGCPWRVGAAPVRHLAMFTQHPVKAGLAAEIKTLVRQRRNDPGRRGVGEARLIRHRDDLRPFRLGQRMGWRWPDRVRPPVATGQAFVLPLALNRARVEPGERARRRLPRATVPGLFDLPRQGLAIFQAGHASAPSWKIAESFFDSTSKAAVSANALSLRFRSRSSSLMRRRSRFASAV